MHQSSKTNYTGIYNRYVKRCIDLVLALILCVVLLPIYFILAALVALEDGFPVFYRPQRGGYKNKPFRIFKFRTMVKNADQIGGGTTALNDPRITKVGNFLRKTKLDETPQLFNIIAGTMSFVGPRPELLKYTAQYTGEEELIHQVRPGITGLAQVNGRNAISWEKRFEYDVQYVDNITFLGDWKIMFRTVGKVLKRDGITSATSVTMEEFMGR